MTDLSFDNNMNNVFYVYLFVFLQSVNILLQSESDYFSDNQKVIISLSIYYLTNQ